MPETVGDLVKKLRKAGFTMVSKQRGKGSHRRFYHPKQGVPPITICRHDGDDAPAYLVKQVRNAMEAAK